MADKKKIAFYCILSSGHVTVCVAIAKAILEQHEGKVDIYFIVDQVWEEKIKKMDGRFKFARINYDSKEAESRLANMVDKFRVFLTMPQIQRTIALWSTFIEDRVAIEIDDKTKEKLDEIKPDFILCDQIIHFPSCQPYPYGYILSANPLAFSFDGYPIMGTDIGVDEKDKIQEAKDMCEDVQNTCMKKVQSYFTEKGLEVPKDLPLGDKGILRPLSKHFSIYSYPAELEYYPEEIREKYNLWQIDGPLLKERIPSPYKLPADFEALPGKIIYVSLGSLFSAYVDILQRMIDILDKVPNCKFIISKGPNGDKLKFPSNKFIGENYIDQLGVLQICDGYICHGGNNSFAESFYFGVRLIVAPVLGDQINNAKHVEETGYGYRIDLMNYSEEELISKVDKLLNNEELRIKLKKISERIQKESRIHQVASKIVNYVDNLKK